MLGAMTDTSRIMLVDDNLGFLMVLREYLAEVPEIEIVGTALTAEDALQTLDDLHPSLVIMDFSMPGMTGPDLTRAIKKRWPSITTIILTLFDSPHHREAANAAGADAFVAKNRMDTDLLPVLERLVT